MKKLFLLSLVVSFGLCACNGSNINTSDADFQQTSAAILNGKPDTSDAHKAVVALQQNTSPDSLFCTGTLVSPSVVITAAHCVADIGEELEYSEYTDDCHWSGVVSAYQFSTAAQNMVIAVGSTADDRAKQTYAVKNVTIPKTYGDQYVVEGCDRDGNYINQNLTVDDIAIVELEKPVPENVAKPIPVLPPWIASRLDLYHNGLESEFVGFGFNEKGELGTKLALSLPLTDICYKDTPEKKYCTYKEGIRVNACHPNKEYCKNDGWVDTTLYNTVYPVGTLFYLQEKGGPCQGDSGGPAFVKIGGKEYLAGVTSNGDQTCTGFGVSTDVRSFYDLIVDTAPEVGSQYKEICGNGIDDNGDGKTDDEDSACRPCSVTFTYNNPYTNKASGGDGDFDVYLVGSFNAEADGTWIMNDDRFKMKSDGNGTHTITIDVYQNDSIEYKYYVKGWVNEETGEDNGWKSDNLSGENSIANITTCNMKFGYQAPTNCKATFTYNNPYTNIASGGEGDFDVYLVGSFNADRNGKWISDDPNYKMTSDGNGTHTITVDVMAGDIFEYKYYVKGWVDEQTGEDHGWVSDDLYGGPVKAEITTCNQRFGVGADEPYCGNGVIDDGELCDSADFGKIGSECVFWNEEYVGGLVQCKSDCTVDLSQCRFVEEGTNGSTGSGNANSNRISLEAGTAFPEQPSYGLGSISMEDFKNNTAPLGAEEYIPVAYEESDDSGCSTTPLRNGSVPAGLLLLMGLGTAVVVRRRGIKVKK